MSKIFILFLFLLSATFSSAQELFLVQLKEKENTSEYFETPLKMLSQRSLDRRAKYSIDLDQRDVPISSDRISQIKQLNLNYIGQTKWLNTIMVEITNQSVISQLQSLNFVASVQSMVRNQNVSKEKKQSKNIDTAAKNANYIYGDSDTFIEQLNLKPLHNDGFLGQGIFIGVIDSGFSGVNTINAFKTLRDENRIIDTYDFVENNENVYGSNAHGTNVLSTIAAEVDGSYVGTAPKAMFSLYRSEDAFPETPRELMYWIQAAERSDSVGVDIINTSLGYSEFDDARYNYTYEDMDGKTTLISLGAQVAIDKGILLVVASGNEGNSSWKYISAPADVADVFTVGANNSQKDPAPFSSYGPNADGVLKPNVAALGQRIAVYNQSNQIMLSNGTSFSSPVIAGAMAVMLQKFPTVSLTTLKQKVEESAHLYENPTYQLGYGIPDFYKAFQELLSSNDVKPERNLLTVYPNPFINEIKVETKEGVKQIEIFNLIGQRIVNSSNNSLIATHQLKSGVYLLKVIDNKGNVFTQKIIKK